MHTYNKLDVSDVTAAGANLGFWPTAGIGRPMRPLLMAFCHANVAKLGRKKRNCPKFAKYGKQGKGIDLSSGRNGTKVATTQHSFLFFAIACFVIWLALIFGHTT